MDEHLHKMEEAAKLSDHRAKEEMEKLGKLAATGGGHHTSEGHTSTHVSLSLSYDASHEMVVSAMVLNMKRMHELDTHRIKELTQRVKLLEHQSAVDYEREHRMIEEWEHAIAEESRMRMDIHKMTVTIKSHDHDTHHLRQECHEWKEKCEMYHHKYDHSEKDCLEWKAKAHHWEKEAKEWEDKHDNQKKKKKHWKHECKEWEHKYEDIHHHYEELKHKCVEWEEKCHHW
jgi:chromosome segregation ATPase